MTSELLDSALHKRAEAIRRRKIVAELRYDLAHSRDKQITLKARLRRMPESIARQNALAREKHWAEWLENQIDMMNQLILHGDKE